MSIFNDNKYQYWESNLVFVMQLNPVMIINNLSDPALVLMNAWAYQLLRVIAHLESNLSILLEIEDFGILSITYDDMTVIAFLLNNYYQENGINRKVVLNGAKAVMV